MNNSHKLPVVPLQVSHISFKADGTAVIEGRLQLEHPVTFLSEHFVIPEDAMVMNRTMETDPSVIQVEDVPIEFVSVREVLKEKPLISYRCEIMESEQIQYYQDLCFAAGLMRKSPCFACGYNGPGYFQPDQHSCATKHHTLFKPGHDGTRDIISKFHSRSVQGSEYSWNRVLARLNEIGFDEEHVRKSLPDWWVDEVVLTQSGICETVMILARKLNIAPSSMLK